MTPILISAAAILALALLALVAWRLVAGSALPNFGVVEAGSIFRSARLTPRTLRTAAQRHGVRTVLDLGAYRHGSTEEADIVRTAHALGVRRFRFHLKGNGTGNPNFYVQALRLMTDARALPILIHCHAGAQRTGACIILYRHIVQERTMREAVEEALRHGVRPNRDWHMLAYIADFAPRIARAFEKGAPVEGFDPIPFPIDDPEGLIAACRADQPAARAYAPAQAAPP